MPAYTVVTVDDKAAGGTKDNSASKYVSHRFVAGGVVILSVICGMFIGI